MEEEYWKSICKVENIPALTEDFCKFRENPTYTPDFAIPSVWNRYKDLFEKIIKLEKAGYYKNILQAQKLIQGAKSIAERCELGRMDQIVSLTKVQDL